MGYIDNPSCNEQNYFSIGEILVVLFQNFQKMKSKDLFEHFKNKGMLVLESTAKSYELGFSNMLLHVGQIVISNSENISNVHIKCYYDNDKVPKIKNKLFSYFVRHSRMHHVNIDFKHINHIVSSYCKNFYPGTKKQKLYYPGEEIAVRGFSYSYKNDKIYLYVKKEYGIEMDFLNIVFTKY